MASIMQYSVAETPTKKFQCALCRFESESPQLVRDHMRLHHHCTLVLIDRYFGTKLSDESE